jgi:transcriptional regulator with XRE-family HTH domain
MKSAEKEAARKLRFDGLSIKEIARKLNVSRSSVSLWVRDIRLTAAQIEILNARVAQSRDRFAYLSRCHGANQNVEQARIRQEQFRRAGHDLAARDQKFRIICALYWGEGTKSTQGQFSVCNCDPEMLRIFVDWLFSMNLGGRIRFSVQYYAENELSEFEILDWWLKRLPKINPENVRRFVCCKINRASQRKKTGRRPYGTASVSVASTELLCNVLGGIEYLKQLGDW